MTASMRSPVAQPKVVITGAGFGGLGMAIELKRAGLDNFTILEKATELGGVWRENTYPGAGCDVPAPLYSFSFAPNQTWPRRYSLQPEIHRYMKRTATEYGIEQHIRYETEVSSAEFDSHHGRWTLHTNHGDAEADVFVPAVGQLNRPGYPDIPGLEWFRGRIFHSARWDHDYNLTGKRVGVIGTGASAIQFVPEVQREAAKLLVFQRSAPYVFPKFDREYQPWRHRMFRAFPVIQLAGRLGLWLFGETATLGLTGNKLVAKLIEWITLAYLMKKVPDKRLRAKLRPDYQVGCKRVLFSNNYYDAIIQPNVELVTERISEITSNGVRTADDVEREVDVLILGTGFKATEFLAPMKVRGLGGRDLGEVWHEGARAYLGITVPEFPNMFLMYGPNTNLGWNSIIYMLERQARYIVQAVRELTREPGRYLEVRSDVECRFDDEIQRRLRRSVWTLCRSWYRNSNGRVTTNWPGLVSEYHRRTRRLDLTDYRISTAPAAAG